MDKVRHFLTKNGHRFTLIGNSINGFNREEVPLGRIVLSNMYSMEALIGVLVEKGLVNKEEVLKRIEKVAEKPRPVFLGSGHPSV